MSEHPTATQFLDACLARCEQDGHDTAEVRAALAPYLSECDAFDVADALYWFGSDYHSGQWSLGYALLCATGLEGFKVGSNASACEPDSMGEMLYSALESAGLNS